MPHRPRLSNRLPLLALLAAAALVGAPVRAVAQAALPSRSDFRSAMRKLWEDHLTWTRLHLISASANLPDKDVTAKRLLKNQEDIGGALKAFYGDSAAARATALLKEHVMLGGLIIDAAVQTDNTLREPLAKRWAANADSIADLLSSRNPRHWPAARLKVMLRTHLDHSNDQLVARMQKDWEADAAAYDKSHDQILKLADQLSDGIMRQFPRKFGRQ